MKKCVVKGCDSSDSASSVSFHPFPEYPHYRLLWLSRIKGCKFNKHSVVCGRHFRPEDYDAHNQLRYDAIPQNTGCSNSTQSHDKISTKKPFIVISTNNFKDKPLIELTPSTMNETTDMNEETLDIKTVIKEVVIPDESTDFKACRACLATDCKMFRLKNKKLKQAYNQVTGLKAPPNDGLPEFLCWECSSRVLSAAKFSERAKAAHDVLSVLKCKHGSINKGVIRTVNRKRMKLGSQLSHEYDVYSDGNLTEITKSDNVDNNAECYTNHSNSSIGPSGLDDYHENYEGVNVKSEDEIDQPVKSVADSNEILMTNEEILLMDSILDDDKSLSSISSDVKIDDDVVRIKSVQETINTNALKKLKNDRSRKPMVRRISSRGTSPEDDISKFFTITSVKLEDAIASVQDRKHSKKYLNAPFRCEICYRGYLIKDHYEAHVLKHTEKFGVYECVVCKIRCRSQHRLAVHGRLHLNTYSCLRCDHVTSSRSIAIEHLQYHDGVVYQCPHCPKQFHKKTTYYGHLRIKHASEFVCELCGHTFLSKYGVEVHKSRRHVLDNANDLAGPHCDACDVTFASQRAFDTHSTMSSKHNKDKQKSIVNEYEPNPRRQRRERRRTGRPKGTPTTHTPVTCEKCGERLNSVMSYVCHFRKHHPGEARAQYLPRTLPFICDQCGRKFHCMSLLMDHIAAHRGELLSCDQCGKRFASKVRLGVHMKVHQPTRTTYPCRICGKQFTQSRNMQRHLRKHMTPLPYKCEACGKRLTTSTGLKSHVDHVHNGVPWPKRTRTRTKNSNKKKNSSKSR